MTPWYRPPSKTRVGAASLPSGWPSVNVAVTPRIDTMPSVQFVLPVTVRTVPSDTRVRVLLETISVAPSVSLPIITNRSPDVAAATAVASDG